VRAVEDAQVYRPSQDDTGMHAKVPWSLFFFYATALALGPVAVGIAWSKHEPGTQISSRLSGSGSGRDFGAQQPQKIGAIRLAGKMFMLNATRTVDVLAYCSPSQHACEAHHAAHLILVFAAGSHSNGG
jgi:hypothetical protein